MGYTPLGIVFGFLFVQQGADWWLAPLMSLLLFAGAAQSLLCEIGFGTGSATWKLVQIHPEALYLGIEVYRGGIAALMQKGRRDGAG